MLSEAKHLSADRDRPFAKRGVTGCDCSTGQGLFFTIEPCLTKIKWHTDGRSCAIHRACGWRKIHSSGFISIIGLRYSELYLGYGKGRILTGPQHSQLPTRVG